MPVVAKDSSDLAPLLAEDTHVKNNTSSEQSQTALIIGAYTTYGPKPPSIVTVMFKREACIE